RALPRPTAHTNTRWHGRDQPTQRKTTKQRRVTPHSLTSRGVPESGGGYDVVRHGISVTAHVPAVAAHVVGMTKKLLNQNDVAEQLDVSVRTVEAWRDRRTGPAFVRIGANVRYQQEAIDRYIAEHTVTFDA
ncbi:helix-turn-helix transcriptional regulator, partial [Microbacterium sp.]|uniref:helix-turn-helix transcriptional regulator n=1 Tax=Microbacterium sp. TaxID=51671 RepID=UPI003A8947D4